MLGPQYNAGTYLLRIELQTKLTHVIHQIGILTKAWQGHRKQSQRDSKVWDHEQ